LIILQSRIFYLLIKKTMKKAGYYVLLALGVGVAGYFTIQNVLPQDEEVVMYGEVDEARTKRASLQSMSCSATNAGTLRYSNGCFQYCDGKGAWINKGAGCDASSHTISCIGLPVANASWNTTSSITQTRNGDEWLPTAIGSYNITGSNSECRFKCKENYTYNGGNNTCVVNTKSNQSCTGLVANAEWNTVSSITQTWSGNTWTPTTTGSYNTEISTSECRFKCKTNYTRNNGSKMCVANTKPNQSCTGLPVVNAEWNTVSSITQTWSGNTWTPTTTGSYNTETSTSECRFKCKTNYTRNSDSKTCVASTKSNQSCTGKPAGAIWNTASSITQTWNGNAWTPTTMGSYNTETSTSECRFKCDTSASYLRNGYSCQASTYPGCNANDISV
jgi:hypothetical protein